MAKELEQLVIDAYNRHPANRTNNDLCWVSVIEAIYAKDGITPPREFLEKILNKELPTSHSLAAAISNVREAHPEYQLTEEMKVLKDTHRQEWIERRNNYLNRNR